MHVETAFALCCVGVIALGCSAAPAHGGSSVGGGAGASSSGPSGSGGAGNGGGGSGGAVTNFPEAAHPPLPQVKDFGGPVLATPKLVSVTFPGDPYVTQIDDFVSTVGKTAYFTGNVAEYGVGPATAGGAVHLTSNPFPGTVDDTQIQSWLAAQIGASSGLPAEDGSTVYVLFFLDTQTVTHGGASSCTQFGGYHGEAPLAGGGAAPYAIVARCPAATVGPTGVAQVTGTASHEIIESSTDPFPSTKPAYEEVLVSDFAWEIGVGGGEIADLCAENADAFFQPAGFAYTVQRTWSNKAALAGHDPCQPAPAGAYFNSGAVMPDMIGLSLIENGTPTQVEVVGVDIPVGSSKTIELELFSDAPTAGPWTVSATDFTVPPQMPFITFAFDKTTGQNGDVIHLTLSPLQASFSGTESFAIKSTLNGATNTWIGLIGNN